MRFLKNFLRKLKLTLIFQGGYPRSGLHYNVVQFPWRSSLFIPVCFSQKRGEKHGFSKKRGNEEIIQKRFSLLFIPEGYSQKHPILQRGKKHGLSKNEEMKKVSKNGFPHFLSQKDIPGYPFHGFQLFDFSFPLGPNWGKMTLFSYFFFSLYTYSYIFLYWNIP